MPSIGRAPNEAKEAWRETHVEPGGRGPDDNRLGSAASEARDPRSLPLTKNSQGETEKAGWTCIE